MMYLRMMTIAIIATLATSGAFGESNDQLDRKGKIKLLRSYASQLKMTAVSDPDTPIEFRKQPLMHWTNPTRSDAFGGLYLWTRNSRPMAIAGVFARLEESATHVNQEFHSLTKLPLKIESDGKQVWTPTVAGVSFRAVADPNTPATSAGARLRQMKNLAGQFSIVISTPRSEVETLRVLPRPIYRYSEPEAGLIDGAIIAFSPGTDPEALLLVEARSSPGTRRWHYAIVRCTSWAVRARMNKEVVYDVPVVRRADTDMSAAYYFVKRTTVK